MKTPVFPVPIDSMQNLLKPVPLYSKESVKEPVPLMVCLIMYGKEAKIKKYDYMVYSEIKQRLKILTKEQVRFGDYDFMHYK
jgi:hypothetical protein